MKGYLYILESQTYKLLYLGSTKDPVLREIEHNKGTTKATKNKGPWEITMVWEFEDIVLAKQIEYKIKKMNRKLSIEYVNYFVDKWRKNKR